MTVSDSEKVVTHSDYKRYYGFSRTHFGKDLAPAQVFAHAGHLEAVARIGWLVEQTAIGMVTGEVGIGYVAMLRYTDNRHAIASTNPEIYAAKIGSLSFAYSRGDDSMRVR